MYKYIYMHALVCRHQFFASFWRPAEIASGPLRFLLNNQYCFNQELQQLMLVTRGSGMGASHSGAVSDKTFYELCERWVLNPATTRQFCIRTWLRYRDDIFLILGGTGATRRDFVFGLRDRLKGVWDLELESVGVEANMLDVTVMIVPCQYGSGRASIEYKPYSKPTHRPLPLLNTSMHASFVFGWPKAQVSRLWNNSSSWSAFLQARRNLFERYSSEFMDMLTVKECMSIDPRCVRRNRSVTRCKTFALVLDFHPGLQSLRLNSLLKEVERDYQHELSNIFGQRISFRLAWRNSSANLLHKSRMLGRNSDKAPKGGW